MLWLRLVCNCLCFDLIGGSLIETSGGGFWFRVLCDENGERLLAATNCWTANKTASRIEEEAGRQRLI